MGKNKGVYKSRNVFKVSTARSNKLKTKAKKVVTNLKKLDLISKESKSNNENKNKDKNKDKTMNINQLMDELYKSMQSQPDKKPDSIQKKPTRENKACLLVPKITSAQMATAATMVEKMEL